ncbi:MAG TPA: cyclase [Rhodospirillaceae bacterium]|nr:cyclase [Rhodospirillaceae bacterium]
MTRLMTRAARSCAAAALLCLTASLQSTAGDRPGVSPWGPNDEIGSLNMMTEESRGEALRRAAGGKVYDLGVDLFVGMPDCCSAAFGDPAYQFWMTHVPARRAGERVAHSSDALSMNTHTGTHLDMLSHFGLHGRIWNGVSADTALNAHGWAKSGAEKVPPIVARGVMIDLAGARNLRHLPASYAVTVDDLKAALARQGTTLSPGDVVLLRTGLMTLWPDRAKLQLFNQAGLGLEAARWLVEDQKVMLLGADNFGLESFPSRDPQNFAPVHTYLLAEKGVPFLELLWLEELARERVYEFLFVAAPLKLRGATGAPVRPLAIPLRTRG